MQKSTHTPEYAFLRLQLRAARQSAGLSQRDLSTLLKVPHSWIAKVETGERRIDLVEFCWFVSACGLDPIPLCSRLVQQTLKKQSGRQAKGGRTK
jgi:transcriptional regulator with XRE-family HTH domain